jgi:hypothetical protein
MIIGVAGYARAGKDTIADYLVEKHGFVKMSFAEPIKEALLKLNPSIQVMPNLYVPLAYAVRTWGWDLLKDISADVRPLLQRMGTEVAREMFGQNFWVDFAMSKALAQDKVVISDVRYINEANAIRSHGIVWRVERNGVGPANDHPSEHDLDSYSFDSVLTNNSSVEELHQSIDAALLGVAQKLWPVVGSGNDRV